MTHIHVNHQRGTWSVGVDSGGIFEALMLNEGGVSGDVLSFTHRSWQHPPPHLAISHLLVISLHVPLSITNCSKVHPKSSSFLNHTGKLFYICHCQRKVKHQRLGTGQHLGSCRDPLHYLAQGHFCRL